MPVDSKLKTSQLTEFDSTACNGTSPISCLSQSFYVCVIVYMNDKFYKCHIKNGETRFNVRIQLIIYQEIEYNRFVEERRGKLNRSILTTRYGVWFSWFLLCGRKLKGEMNIWYVRLLAFWGMYSTLSAKHIEKNPLLAKLRQNCTQLLLFIFVAFFF